MSSIAISRRARLEARFEIPRSAANLRGFREWARSDAFPEHGRVCFLDGRVFIDMSPEEIETHLKVKEAITHEVGTLNREADFGELYPDGALVTNEEAGLSTVPDAVMVFWESFLSGRVTLVPRKDVDNEYIELQCSPDWLLEVVSATSEEKDTEILPVLYHRARVKEYWLVQARGDRIVFQILKYRRDRYVAAATRNGWQKSSVFGFSFRLTRTRNRLGRWKYQLESRRA